MYEFLRLAWYAFFFEDAHPGIRISAARTRIMKVMLLK
jgi:hypothetical protein